jgi:arylsulfatase A-like enzyme
MGQKDYLFKNSPWEESTRVPFIIRAPGVAKAGSVCQQPISLIDLYPTLVDLCGLKGDTRKNKTGAKLDGHSVRPFLADPENGKWVGPDAALSMIFVGQQATGQGLSKDEVWDVVNQNWSIRTAHWRYIRYRTGAEELYDHRTDPREWTNLADDPKFDTQKQEMRERLHTMVPAIFGQ